MEQAAPDTPPVLQNRRVLVVEDEYMIAQDVASMLSGLGAETLGPVASVNDALRLVETGNRIDAGLLDVNLRGEAIWPVVDALRALGLPVVLTTGYDADAVPPAYAGLPRCEKPVEFRRLARTLARVLAPEGVFPTN